MILAEQGPLPAPAAMAILRQLLDQVGRLHLAGRLHRAIRVNAVLVDAGRATLLTESARSGDVESDARPPDLTPARGIELPDELPPDLAAARRVLRECGLDVDPRRVDVYGLGAILCRMLTGGSVRDYLRSPRVKAAVPQDIIPVIDRALGFEAAWRLTDCAALAAVMDAAPRAANEAGVGPAVGQTDGPIARSDQGGQPSDTRLPFQRLGHYRIEKRIGRGGMGDVYLAFEEALDRVVAIKVLPAKDADDDANVRRFRSEAAALARLTHPNLVPVHFVGLEGDHHYFVMQYVEGESLGSLLARKGRLGARQAAGILENCLEGLMAAHQSGVVHRDVKPSNILLETRTGRALLADFGLAKLVGGGSGLTRSGIVVGTVGYLSPEQARGERVDVRSDLYSLGVVAYQMLSGRLPFDADTPSRMLYQHAHEEVRPLRETAPWVPEGLAAVVDRLLAGTLERRYSSSGKALADLRSWRDGDPGACVREAVDGRALPPPIPDEGPTEALPPARPRRSRSRRGLRRLLVAFGLLVALMAGGSLAARLSRGHPSGETGPRETAEPGQKSDGVPVLGVAPLTVPAAVEVAPGKSIRFVGHENTVYAVAISPDGRRLLSGSQDKTARLWDARTGQLLRASAEPTYWVTAVAFSPAGRWAASPSDPSRVRVWEIETGKERCLFTGHKAPIRCAAFSADGSRILTGSPEPGGLFLWDSSAGSLFRHLKGHTDSVAVVALSGDGGLALSGGSAGSLILWDLVGNKGRQLFGHKGANLVGVGISADGRSLASADTTRIVRTWNRVSGAMTGQFLVHCVGPVQQAAFSAKLDRVLLGCEDGTLRLIDTTGGKELACLRGHEGGVTAVALSTDGRTAVSGGKDRTVRIWPLPR